MLTPMLRRKFEQWERHADTVFKIHYGEVVFLMFELELLVFGPPDGSWLIKPPISSRPVAKPHLLSTSVLHPTST